MTSHMNSNKTNNVESKHGDFDGEMDEIPETDLSIRVRPYIYEPLKVGVRITIIPIRKARRSQRKIQTAQVTIYTWDRREVRICLERFSFSDRNIQYSIYELINSAFQYYEVKFLENDHIKSNLDLVIAIWSL